MCGLLTLNTHSRRPTEVGYRLFSFPLQHLLFLLLTPYLCLKHLFYFSVFASFFSIIFKAYIMFLGICCSYKSTSLGQDV